MHCIGPGLKISWCVTPKRCDHLAHSLLYHHKSSKVARTFLLDLLILLHLTPSYRPGSEHSKQALLKPGRFVVLVLYPPPHRLAMHNDENVDFFPWIDPNTHDSVADFKMPEVKEEVQSDFSSLFSPPSSPFITGTNPSVPSQPRTRTTKSESPRTRPYPDLHRSEDTIGMSGTSGSGYDNWSRPNRGLVERRSSDGDRPWYQTGTYDPSSTRSAVLMSRSSSTSSSSLGGAVASGASGSQTRLASLSPRHSGGNLAAMSWHQSPMPLSATPDLSLYPGVAGEISYHLPDDPNYGGYTSGTPSSAMNYSYDETIQTLPGYVQTTLNDSPPNSSTTEDLQRRIDELELRHRRDKDQIRALQAQIATGSAPPTSPSFEASWRARSEARIKQFCSLNRAGNALCAWHDSRRERRIYPPRMAPFGTLNCGCTYEQALFEESLSRHNVGSYLPGDSVRMDPALRNPLLKLLEERYNYRDGDFERDPVTGNWLPGEGSAYWEQQAASGVNPRRPQHRDQQHR
ncbi:hypothetical protein GYMLUDRAFT_34551 [Collybiopsis luxurians FD-317 M1]|nr:hypothetical protein GYMLUDRAFT_34551 [Collybiopsis luxurians FD-317 M1]